MMAPEQCAACRIISLRAHRATPGDGPGLRPMASGRVGDVDPPASCRLGAQLRRTRWARGHLRSVQVGRVGRRYIESTRPTAWLPHVSLRLYPVVKRLLDVAGAGAGLTIAAPSLAVLAL